MCGIAGIVGEFCDRNTIPAMLDALKHRGPDARGEYASEGVHIGHCRLSINDLSERATQPFVTDDDEVAVAVNGEIYNYKGLKRQLQDKGYVFKSDSDSEVVFHGFLEYGLGFVRELNGMFAISIWDGRKRELALIRDRLGIKPIYYAITKDTFLFASEIKALAQYDALDLSLDVQSFAEYMTFENYFSNRTLNRSTKMVEPGEIVRFRSRDMSIEREYFWTPAFGDQNADCSNDIYDNYRVVLESSVRRHLLSDVPLGVYLSGGIDSSSVVYCSSKILGQSLKTFTGYFGMSGFYNESNEATRVAKACGCVNNLVEIGPQEFIDNVEKVIWHLDEPRVGVGAFSQYMVARKASQEVKVILTGHGGDEFFAGYPVFKAIYGKQNSHKLITRSSLRELMFAIYFIVFPLVRKEAGYFLPNIYPLKTLRNILAPDFYSLIKDSSDVFKEFEKLKSRCSNEYERLTLTYLRYYLPALFNVEDKISMAFSMESRTPLCDNNMIDFALSIPLSLKLGNHELKHIPKTAMRGRLPNFIFSLPKKGFPTPMRYWFKNELKEYIRTFILDNVASLKIFNAKEVEKLVSRSQNSILNTPLDEIAAHRLWVLLNLIIYFKNQRQRYKRI